MTKGWTEERRRAQAERCRQNKPWEKSTGPKTEDGKRRSAMNAYKHGRRSREFDRFRYMLWLNREFVRMVGYVAGLPAPNELKKIRKRSLKNK